MQVARTYIGISGWTYRAWRGDFYPDGLPQRRELAYAASRMTSVEVNGSFYSLQWPSSWQRWAEEVPDGFVFAVKGSRFITHFKRLVDTRAPLANFLASGVLSLGDRLGPLLWQLPATVQHDEQRLADFLALLPRTTGEAAALAAQHDDRIAEERVWRGEVVDRPLQHALEPRHPSFASERAQAQLADAGVAVVVAESAGRWPVLDQARGPFVYVRLHGETDLYTSRYSDLALDRWAERVRAWTEEGRDVHVYFDNDARGHAPHDALRLIGRLEGAAPGWTPLVTG
ncbi:MAG: hypothetical protein JWN22_2877, partial [Nocardioides sp.]|nr:hypothetical protein [Nocardioides sp.]